MPVDRESVQLLEITQRKRFDEIMQRERFDSDLPERDSTDEQHPYEDVES